MSDEPIPFTLSERGELVAKRLRIEELEHILRHFDRTSLDLHLYVQAIDRMPTFEQWQLVREQIAEMVAPYGPRNPHV